MFRFFFDRAKLIDVTGYKARQSSLLYVFVLFYGLDRVQNTIVVCWEIIQLNRFGYR